MDEYYVWFDLLMEDHFSIKKDEMKESFKNQLIEEGVIIHEVFSNGEKSAINQIYPKENRNFQISTIH